MKHFSFYKSVEAFKVNLVEIGPSDWVVFYWSQMYMAWPPAGWKMKVPLGISVSTTKVRVG